MMMHNRRKILGCICIIAIVCIMSLSLSPMMALRAAIFMNSPKSALTIEYEYLVHESKIEGKELYRIVDNAPMERNTETELRTWWVHSIGPFHYATYFGEA